MLTGSAYLNLVRDNQRIRADNLRMRQEEIERAPAPEYTPQRQVPAARNRLRWGDEEKETFVSELASVELNLTEVNSAVLMHLSQPGSHSLLDLSTSAQNISQKLKYLYQKEQRFAETSTPLAENISRRLRTANASLCNLQKVLLSNRAGQNQAPAALPAAGSNRVSSPLHPLLLRSHLQPEQTLAHIKRVELPQLSGKVEDFWEWRGVFRALVTDASPPPPLYLHQLRTHLKGDAKEMIQGITNIEDAWQVLDMQFGDTSAAIVTITTKLRHLKLGGAPHEKLESLARGVQQAITSLHEVGAEALLASDFSLIGCLVEKLAPAQAEKWNEHVAKSGQPVSWNMFVCWLGEARKVAHATRSGSLGTVWPLDRDWGQAL